MAYLSHVGADAPGLAAPASGNILVRPLPGADPGAAGPQDHTQDDAAIIGRANEDRTPLARLKALAALRGMVVIDLADGSLLVTRWGLTRAVPDACVLAQFLRQMGVPI